MTTIDTILITSTKASFLPIEAWAKKHEIKLIFQPFISIEPVLNVEIPQTDWVFFSSPKGAKTYLDHYPIKAEKIAVFGEGTERITSQHNLSVDFKGKHHESPIEIGQAFEAKMQPNEVALFPIGNRSRKTVINAIDPTKVKTISTYQTVYTSNKLKKQPDIILFTSPSNFESFIIENTLAAETQLIAMGETSGNTIRKHAENANLRVLKSPTAKALLDILNSVTS